MSRYRLFVWLALFAGLLAGVRLLAEPPRGKAPPAVRGSSDAELVERLISARRDYQTILENIRAHYIMAGDIERARWAEEELVGYHRIPKFAFRLDLDVPPPGLHKQGSINIPEANELYRRGLSFKDKGWGTDYTDNQRRAELLFQQLLTNYPLSDKISDAAYQLGDIYESKAYHQYDRAAAYFERCFQWNSKTQLDARMRAARLYERNLNERGRALEIYKEIQTTEIDPKRVEEAQRRATSLSGKK